MTTAVLVCLRIVRILNTKSYLIADSHDVDVYKTVFCGADAVFECILDKRNEDQRCYLHRWIAYLRHECHVDIARKPYLHKVNVVLDFGTARIPLGRTYTLMTGSVPNIDNVVVRDNKSERKWKLSFVGNDLKATSDTWFHIRLR